jgi:hypothetical protein
MRSGGTKKIIESFRTIRELQRHAPDLTGFSRVGAAQLSFSQEWIWLLNHISPGNPVFNTSRAYRISGSLNLVTLTQSLRLTVQRHDILRTSFPSEVRGNPLPKISVRAAVMPLLVNLQSVEEIERDIECAKICSQTLDRPFNIERGPVLRVVAVSLAPDRHLILFVSHQIVMDGWSWSVFVGNVIEDYVAFCAGSPSAVSEVTTQYVDFSAWQRSWLQGGARERLQSFWKKELSGSLPEVNIPTDHPRSEAHSFSSSSESAILQKDLSDSLRSLSEREGVTLFVTLLAVFKTLLYRYSPQRDIVVVSPTAGRYRPEVRDSIGPISNNLILRTEFSDNPSFRELLARVHEGFLRAFAHQDLPFDQKVDVLQQSSEATHDSLLNVLFILESAPSPRIEVEGLRLDPIHLGKGTEKFDIYLSVEEGDKGLTCIWTYRTDLFKAQSVKRMMENYENLARHAVEGPSRVILDLPFTPSPAGDQVTMGREQSEIPISKAGADITHNLPGPGDEKPGSPPVPQTELQSVIAKVWQDVLKRDKIDINDGFFEQGGHSLLLIRAATRLKEILKRDISLMEMFRHPTVSALAGYLSGGQEAPSSYGDVQRRVIKGRESRRKRMELHRRKTGHR